MGQLVKVLLGTLIALVLFVFGGALLLDPAYAVSRSVLVAAPAERIYPLLSTPQGWADWGVWYRRDPQMQVTTSGAAEGVGAVWSWRSESQGNGAMELTAAEPGQRVAYTLTIEGFDPSRGEITLASEAGGTRVSWSMRGEMTQLIGRWFGLMMDRLVGPDFEEGLANLKTLAEQPA